MGPITAIPADAAACLAHAGLVARVDAVSETVTELRAEVVRQGELTRAASHHVTAGLGSLAVELRGELGELGASVRALRDAEQRRLGRSQADEDRAAWVDAHRAAVERSTWIRSRALRAVVKAGALLAAAGAGGWLWQAAPGVWRALIGG